jgi:hypothetical protein
MEVRRRGDLWLGRMNDLQANRPARARDRTVQCNPTSGFPHVQMKMPKLGSLCGIRRPLARRKSTEKWTNQPELLETSLRPVILAPTVISF